jgi:hypothetical protein
MDFGLLTYYTCTNVSVDTVIAWHETYYELLRIKNKHSLLFASMTLSPTPPPLASLTGVRRGGEPNL